MGTASDFANQAVTDAAMANSESHREVLRRASDESSRVAHMVQDMVSEKVAIIKPPWMLELGLPRLDTDIMGRIWSFQRKDVYKSTCYISLATMAADVKSDRSNVKKRSDKLGELGLLIKSPRGTQSILPSLKGYGLYEPIALFLFLTNYGLKQPTV